MSNLFGSNDYTTYYSVSGKYYNSRNDPDMSKKKEMREHFKELDKLGFTERNREGFTVKSDAQNYLDNIPSKLRIHLDVIEYVNL